MDNGVGMLGRDADQALVLLVVANVVEKIKIWSCQLEIQVFKSRGILHMLSMMTRKFVFMSVIE